MLDEIGSAHMSQGALTNFTFDRFNCPNSSLALNGGWAKVPSGIYFDSSEFTISVWVYPKHVGSYARVLDFGSGPNSDNIIFSLSDRDTIKPYIALLYGSNWNVFASSATNLSLNQWQFLVATFNGSTSSIYLNGPLTIQLIQPFSLSTLPRANCYVGKSNWPSDGYSYSYLDELRFYNKSLTQTEIVSLMNQNQTSIK